MNLNAVACDTNGTGTIVLLVSEAHCPRTGIRMMRQTFYPDLPLAPVDWKGRCRSRRIWKRALTAGSLNVRTHNSSTHLCDLCADKVNRRYRRCGLA